MFVFHVIIDPYNIFGVVKYKQLGHPILHFKLDLQNVPFYSCNANCKTLHISMTSYQLKFKSFAVNIGNSSMGKPMCCHSCPLCGLANLCIMLNGMVLMLCKRCNDKITFCS